MTALALQGMVPITHLLGGSRSHTTGIAVATRTTGAFRAKIVVRIVLVPFGLNEVFVFAASVARHHTTRLFQHGPIGRHGRLDRGLSGHHHAVANAFKIIGQSGSHIVDVEVALVGITDDGTIVVVGSHDDKTCISHIEDVIAGFSPLGELSFHKMQVGFVLEFGCHKRLP